MKFQKGNTFGFKKGNNFAFKKGHKSWNKDKTNVYTKETIEKMKKIDRKEQGKGISKTIDHKKNISKAKKGKPGLKGDKHWNWQGGITPENVKVRMSLNYKMWHKSCLERDRFTCQISGQSGGKLVVHHINNFADFPELRFAIDYGITMTKKLHILFHHIYGKKNNTYEQLEEFIKNYI